MSIVWPVQRSTLNEYSVLACHNESLGEINWYSTVTHCEGLLSPPVSDYLRVSCVFLFLISSEYTKYHDCGCVDTHFQHHHSVVLQRRNNNPYEETVNPTQSNYSTNSILSRAHKFHRGEWKVVIMCLVAFYVTIFEWPTGSLLYLSAGLTRHVKSTPNLGGYWCGLRQLRIIVLSARWTKRRVPTSERFVVPITIFSHQTANLVDYPSLRFQIFNHSSLIRCLLSPDIWRQQRYDASNKVNLILIYCNDPP